MAFRIALSGLNAAAGHLDVTANNIANAATIGFKGSRIEFAEVMSSGVRVAASPQQFANGNIQFTGNSLDLGLNGSGFFTMSDNGELLYTRAGAFGVNDEGYVVNTVGQRLQVYPETGAGVFDIGNMEDLRLTVTDSQPQATSLGEIGVNLPAEAQPPVTPVFDPADSSSFNHTTSTTVYDSLGVAHAGTFYFVKDAADGAWNVNLLIDGDQVGAAQPLQFSGSGNLLSPASGLVDFPGYDPLNGAEPIDTQFDFTLATQFGGEFSVNNLTQNGFAPGLLTGIDIDPEGEVLARFTNGESLSLGQVALTRFVNPQGLASDGDNNWVETASSGEPIRGAAGTANFGLVQSGALEQSTVDLTRELVEMIVAQRNFQANAEMISTEAELTQTIINIR